MKMPLSIKVIQGFMLLQVIVLGGLYFVVSQVDPMNLNHWASKMVFSVVTMPEDMLDQSYVLGRMQGRLMLPLIITTLLFIFIQMRFFKSAIVCISLAILLDISNGAFLIAIVYVTLLLVVTHNKQSKAYFNRNHHQVTQAVSK
ncbi:hypothetical protein [Brevibacillus porteri]|uniref:Uncharacterized protein n=1 Tax=Brevibacillus porteri TaxID=2126350 RepID=A0ABX5FWX9_9BACL|nr:hypothetical protein [Brevibacillus porteri]MED1800937.1 hypothetical protein [Brevibacillus porteri]MED2130323.1 hypothetical protein [Brevibacillus porteri]MED2742834.1 hypothetical protein [Brevibacillus porteri]MED2817286.1 hypothetical protein [Brevibacillus porteri]MED2895950.1 hypothetical protein [Brevibacillus porteri]